MNDGPTSKNGVPANNGGTKGNARRRAKAKRKDNAENAPSEARIGKHRREKDIMKESVIVVVRSAMSRLKQTLSSALCPSRGAPAAPDAADARVGRDDRDT